jgi:hypothetical protein
MIVQNNFFASNLYACRDARFLLARHLGNTTTDTIEVQLGVNNNQNSKIIANYGGHTGEQSVESPGEAIVPSRPPSK